VEAVKLEAAETDNETDPAVLPAAVTFNETFAVPLFSSTDLSALKNANVYG
jgi:hypothetical protein